MTNLILKLKKMFFLVYRKCTKGFIRFILKNQNIIISEKMYYFMNFLLAMFRKNVLFYEFPFGHVDQNRLISNVILYKVFCFSTQ